MFSILFREVCLLCRNISINTKTNIQDTNATISLGMLEFIAFVLEDSYFTQHNKAVCKTTEKAAGDCPPLIQQLHAVHM